jgi:hypothetical protein
MIFKNAGKEQPNGLLQSRPPRRSKKNCHPPLPRAFSLPFLTDVQLENTAAKHKPAIPISVFDISLYDNISHEHNKKIGALSTAAVYDYLTYKTLLRNPRAALIFTSASLSLGQRGPKRLSKTPWGFALQG